MADDSQNPPAPPGAPVAPAGTPAAAGDQASPGEPTPPQAAADKPASHVPGEPLKAEVSRSDAPGAGTSAAPAGPAVPAAPKPAAPAAPKPAATPAAGAAAAAKPAPPKPAAHEPPKAAPPAGPSEPAPPPEMPLPAFITSLQTAMPGAVTHVSYFLGDWTIVIAVGQLVEVARFLRDAPDALFDYCSDVTATDWPPRAERFDVLYLLYSIRHRHRVRLKVKVAEQQPVPSVTGIWAAANWLEREVYDMFGVNFTGHPDRRRILMPEDWQGFPQRKDYPLEGPGELLMENPLDWLKFSQARDQADIE